MSSRIPPEFAGELYCRANIEPMIYNVMNPQIATELLDRAWHMLSQGQISFSFNYIDKPKEGSGFFLKVQPDEGVIAPHDGFQYMDDEVSYGYPGDARLSITERSQGFAPGDQYTHIIRRRYTLTQPGRDTLAFLHYAKADLNRSVVVDARRARTPARQYPLKPIPGILGGPVPMPQQQPQQGYPQGYRPQQAPPKIASPYAGSPINGSPASPQQAPGNYGRFAAVPAPVPGLPAGQTGPQRLASVNSGAYGNQRHEKKSSHKKHQQQHQQPQMTPQQHAHVLAQQQAQAQEDAEEPSGDELDFLTTKDVAVARYKRNHDYIAEVFSPYPTSRIIPTRPEYQQSIAFLKSLSEKHNDDLDAATTEHNEMIKKFKAEASVFYKGLEELKQATTVQEVFAANERVEAFKGMTVQPYSALRQVELSKDELSRTPELKTARIAKEPAEATSTITHAVNGEVPVAPSTSTSAAETMEVDEPKCTTAVPEISSAPSGQQDTDMTHVSDSAPPPESAAARPELSAVPASVPASGPTPESSSDHAPIPASTATVATASMGELTPAVSPLVSTDVVMEESHSAPAQPTPPTVESVSASAKFTPAASSIPIVSTEATIDTPINAPIETLIDTTLKAPIDTPMDTSHESYAPTSTATPSEAPVETPTPVETPALISSETPTPNASVAQPVKDVEMAVNAAQSHLSVGESFMQQSFSTSVSHGGHTTVTTSTNFTTSTTDGYGTTVTDTTRGGETTVTYADGHQEQFPETTIHQHYVEHSNPPVDLPAAQIEAAPGQGIASAVTELGPSSMTSSITEEPSSPVVITPATVPTEVEPTPTMAADVSPMVELQVPSVEKTNESIVP
ncbi:hypothetical protein FBU30_007514 [Linnemannia zychae]|nr:hypothetical protein FBU30_007514 [Linnemannia zychae]